jgi:peptidyl-prolyl cis-trans isomerase D
MMAAFRAFAKSPIAAVLMGVLIISFGIWGVRDVFHVRINNDVITAGSRTISAEEFKLKFQDQLKSFQKQTGQAVSPQDAASQGVIQQFLEDLSGQEAVQEAIRSTGVRPSDQLVINELRKIPAFFNPVTGTFEETTYEGLLAQNNLTPVTFQQQLSDQLAIRHFVTAMTSGLHAPVTYSALFGALDQQSRSADYFLLDPKSEPAPPKPTDAQLNQFIKAHVEQLRQPESRMITLVRISAQEIGKSLHPSDADVEKMFNVEKARLSIPERRTFVQVRAKDASQAAAIAGRLTKGEDATAVAKSYGDKPISYADVPQASVDDTAVGKAVFALQPGQTSAPIKGQFGYSVARLVSVTPAKPATLAEVRPQIEKELNDRAAKDEAYDQSEKYSDAHAKGQNMGAASKASGAKMFPIPIPINAKGQMPNGQPLPSINEKMLKDAFSLPQGGETDINDLGQGEYYALRVDKVSPAHVPGLEEIRAPLTQAYMTNALIQALKAKADGLLARVKKGEPIATVAASAGAKLQHLDLTRVQAEQQGQAYGQALMGNLFNAKKAGEAFESQAPNYGFAVAKVTEIKAGAPADIAKETQTIRAQLDQQFQGNEFGEMFFAASRAKVKPKIDFDLAYSTLGVTPPASAIAPAKGAGKAK